MRTITCVAQGSAQEKYLRSLLIDQQLECEFSTYTDSINRTGAIILVFEEEQIENLIKICENHSHKVLIALHSRREFKFVEKLKVAFENIFGFIDLSQEIDYNTPVVMNYLNMAVTTGNQSIDKLGGDLEKILEYSKVELSRVKEIHDRLVKVRTDKFNEITVLSKFRAGEKSGGEFFDLVESNKTFLYVQAGSNNYITTSLILSELEMIKMQKDKKDLHSLSLDFEQNVLRHLDDDKKQVSYCLIYIDLKNLSIECRFRGEGFLFHNEKLIEFKNVSQLKLRSNDRIFQISNGFMKNIREINPHFKIKETFEEMSDQDDKKILNEFFYELTKNKTGMFLSYDSFMSVIEFTANKLYSV